MKLNLFERLPFPSGSDLKVSRRLYLLLPPPLHYANAPLCSSPLKRGQCFQFVLSRAKTILRALSLFKGDECSVVNTKRNGGGNIN